MGSGGRDAQGTAKGIFGFAAFAWAEMRSHPEYTEGVVC